MHYENSIFQTKDNEICYLDHQNSNNVIYFYDFLQKKIISKLYNINSDYTIKENFIMISKVLLLIPGYYTISIININEHNLIKTIDVSNQNGIKNACMLNKNILITVSFNGTIRQWKIEEDNLILISIKEKAHDYHINSLIEIGDGHIASISYDNTIKIW